jgi:hypothetical protein
MLSSRLNNQLKPGLVLVIGELFIKLYRKDFFPCFFIDENPSNSSLGFQFACAYACEVLNKY